MDNKKESSATFYISAELQEKYPDNDLINRLKHYSEQYYAQVYILNKPLLERNIEYDYNSGAFLLIPNHKICFINFSNDENNKEFEDYIEDVISDLESLVKDYGYIQRIGRKRKWFERLTNIFKLSEVEQIFQDNDITNIELKDENDKRNVNILISLLIGSINSLEKIGNDVPKYELDKIKQKIILFDGEQTRFIFENMENKVLNVQGLAGTGKTELLFHKLKELYLEDENNKIAFTCHSKVLANSLSARIPEFFTYMKVNEQIEWNKRLWVMPAWGSKANKNTGVYSYITNYYDLNFLRYNPGHIDLKIACAAAIKELKKMKKSSFKFDYCFDYILIDESQDFPDEFFQLCELVVRKQLIKVGDIFQNITDTVPKNHDVNILLNRCYRTDNKTLMFSHALSMGLFGKDKKIWLEENEWEKVGYNYELLEDNNVKLSRTPTKRFDDVDESSNPFIKLINCKTNDTKNNSIKKLNKRIIDVIKEIQSNNPTLKPNDVAVVFLNDNKKMYEIATDLEIQIMLDLDMKANIGYLTKVLEDDSLYITNRYNVKGLEFPFVICIANEGLKADLRSRNTLYMAMTRSFISSYLVVENMREQDYDYLNKEIDALNKREALIIKKPTEKQLENIEQRGLDLEINNNISLEKVIELIIDDFKIPDNDKVKRIKKAAGAYFSGENFEYNKVRVFIETLIKSDEHNV
ncbi:DEAD/DEAH box helicase [Staphylococcus hominis]